MPEIPYSLTTRPRCPECGSVQMLVHISILTSVVDLLLCECVPCGRVFKSLPRSTRWHPMTSLDNYPVICVRRHR